MVGTSSKDDEGRDAKNVSKPKPKTPKRVIETIQGNHIAQNFQSLRSSLFQLLICDDLLQY